MTNAEIITRTALAKNLYTKEEVTELISKYGELPLRTFQEWKKDGYSIKKGEHAKLACVIWLPSVKSFTTKNAVTGKETEIDTTCFFHKLAYFFTPEQVERRTNA